MMDHVLKINIRKTIVRFLACNIAKELNLREQAKIMVKEVIAAYQDGERIIPLYLPSSLTGNHTVIATNLIIEDSNHDE